MNIKQATLAKRVLLAAVDDRGVPLIKTAVIVLGDDGYRIEVEVRPGSKWMPPDEAYGVRVVTL